MQYVPQIWTTLGDWFGAYLGGGLYYVLKPDFETWVKPMVTSPFNPNFF